jgi:acetyltransferase-like isoleucine patch superfamily enzyme
VYWVEDLKPLAGTHEVVCPLADGAAKRAFVRQVEPYAFRFTTVCSAMTRVSRRVEIGPGLHLSWGSVICSHVRFGTGATVGIGLVVVKDVPDGVTVVGNNVIIRSGAHISHHCQVANHAFVAAGVTLGGNVNVGEQAFVGIGAVLRDGLTIAERSFVGAGAVVIADTTADGVYVGNPGRKSAATAREVTAV